MRVDVAWGQIQGERLVQEDSAACLAWPHGLHLLVVADGIGGRTGGEVASTTVVDSFRRTFVEASELVARDRLLAALQASNYDLFDRIEADPELDGMGTTIVAACIDGGDLWWVSVGDSPLWLVRDGHIRRLNAKHTVGALLDQQVDVGMISSQQASAAPDRYQLVEAVLGDDINHVDAPSDSLYLRPKDHLLLATDGVETCDLDEIRDTTIQSWRAASDIAEAILERVEAKARPRQDNATIVVAQITE